MIYKNLSSLQIFQYLEVPSAAIADNASLKARIKISQGNFNVDGYRIIEKLPSCCCCLVIISVVALAAVAH